MVDWIKRAKENIWDKSSNGIPSGMLSGVSVSVQGENNPEWIPDTARGWGMKRAFPINRVVGYTHVPARFRGCYPQHTEMFISWSRVPKPCDPCYDQYQKDIFSEEFVGIHKSSCHVVTELKKWMKSQEES